MQRRAVDHLLQRIDIGTYQYAVSGYVGIDNEPRAEVFEPPGKVDRADAGVFRPAGNFGDSVARVDTDRNAFAETFESIAREFEIVHRAGPQNYTLNSGRQKILNR